MGLYVYRNMNKKWVGKLFKSSENATSPTTGQLLLCENKW